jgi:hypothetical protein
MDPQTTIDGLYGTGVYGSIQNMLASGNPQLIERGNKLLQSGMGTQSAIDASRQSARPTSGTNAAGSYQIVDSGNVVRPMSGQNGAGSYQVVDSSSVRMNTPEPQAPAMPAYQERDYNALNASAMRSALEQLNGSGRMANPYGKDNSGYLASQAQVVGQEGQSLLNALRSQNASNAMRGIKQSDGLAQNQQNQLRMQTALGRNAALTGLETQRYDKAAEWDKWDTNNRMQLAQAVDSGNLSRFNSIMGQRNTEFEQNRQSPFDAIKLQDAQTRLGYLDRTLGADLEGKYLGNANQGLQNTRYGMENNAYGQTMQSGVDATNAQNRLSYLGNTQQYGVMNDLGNDAGFRNDIRDGYKWNAARGKTQAMTGFFNDAQQPMRHAEQDVYGRVGNFLDLGLKGGKLFSGAGFGG